MHAGAQRSVIGLGFPFCCDDAPPDEGRGRRHVDEGRRGSRLRHSAALVVVPTIRSSGRWHGQFAQNGQRGERAVGEARVDLAPLVPGEGAVRLHVYVCIGGIKGLDDDAMRQSSDDTTDQSYLLEQRDVGGHFLRVEEVEPAGDGQDLHGRERVEHVRVVAHVAAEPIGGRKKRASGVL